MKQFTNKALRRAAKRWRVKLLKLERLWRHAKERTREELQQAADEEYCLNTYNCGLWASLKEEEEIEEAMAAKYGPDDRYDYDYPASIRC